MVYINNATKNIKMTRGDTAKIQISIELDGELYSPQEGDYIRFAVKYSYHSPDVILVKEIPKDTMLLHIEPEDTKEMYFSKYVYDVEITFENGDVSTFIQGEFEILPEVM